MLMRTHGDIQKRAADLHSKVSSLAQEIVRLEDERERVDTHSVTPTDYPTSHPYWRIAHDIDKLEADKFWMETTLETLEWVLGETDVMPEVPLEGEWKLITSSTK